MTSINKERNSSVELLRIVAMFFILISHSSFHGCFPERQSMLPMNNILLDWFILGNLGVDIFIIISGYFLCEKEDSTKSAKLLHTQVLFYSFLGIFIAYLFNRDLTPKGLIMSLFPVIFQEYWFFTAYIVFLLLTPYINTMIKNFTKEQHLACLSTILFLWVIIPTFTTRPMYGTELPQFFMFYMIGAYMKKYPHYCSCHSSLIKVVTLLSFILLLLSDITLNWISSYIPSVINFTDSMHKRHSLFVVLCAVGLFSISINRKSFNNKIINILGSCTFGVYLIHENFFMRDIIWGTLFPNYKYYDSKTLIIHMLISIFIIYFFCSIFEYIRKRFLEKKCYAIYLFFADKIISNTQYCTKKLLNKLNLLK